MASYVASALWPERLTGLVSHAGYNIVGVKRLGQAYGGHRSNAWACAVRPGFGRASEGGNLAALHPTVKPAAKIADGILHVTRRGDIVLDSFLGSGLTLMACERTGRRRFAFAILRGKSIYREVPA